MLTSEEVASAVRATPVPSLPSRVLQRLAVKRERLTFLEESVGPMVRARRAVLGDAAAGPPRFLVRVDEFPHSEVWGDPDGHGTEAFERFDAVMRDAGVPYLLAVLPHVPRDYLEPTVDEWREHDYTEIAALDRLREDVQRPGGRVVFGVHGLNHRTRDANPRRHSEFAGLKRPELVARLDRADAVLSATGLDTDVLVPPFNRFDARQYGILASRYDVVTGGPESIARMGWHRTPQWRGDAVWLPTYAPLYGRSREILPAVERLTSMQPGLWIPIVLHWDWEQADGPEPLERLAAALAGLARPWDEFLAGVRASRTAG